MDLLLIIINLIIFLTLIGALMLLKKHNVKFSYRVMIGLLAGLVFGAVLQLIYGVEDTVITQTTDWMAIAGDGFVRLLQMIVMPLVFISILGAFAKMDMQEKFLKSGMKIILILLGTTAIAAAIGITAALLFNLDASSLNLGDAENERAASLETSAQEVEDQTLPQQLVSLLPANPFLDFTGERATSTIAVVFFAVFMGLSLVRLIRSNPERSEEHTSELQSRGHLVCRLLLEKKNYTPHHTKIIL